MIFSLYLQQCIDCGLILPLPERQCLVHAKQGGYGIKSHDNLRKKASVFFLKVIEATFCVGVKTKRPTTTLSYTTDPCEGCAEFAPTDKNPRYGPV